uniref:Uncharacterized protein n=1 Tax=Aegilops tauschii TaxID=37682 RepID=R7WA51_AEGTA
MARVSGRASPEPRARQQRRWLGATTVNAGAHRVAQAPQLLPPVAPLHGYILVSMHTRKASSPSGGRHCRTCRSGPAHAPGVRGILLDVYTVASVLRSRGCALGCTHRTTRQLTQVLARDHPCTTIDQWLLYSSSLRRTVVGRSWSSTMVTSRTWVREAARSSVFVDVVQIARERKLSRRQYTSVIGEYFFMVGNKMLLVLEPAEKGIILVYLLLKVH